MSPRKTISATVSLNGTVELKFGYDEELVGFVKQVSGFSYFKPGRLWWGPVHALFALEYAGRQKGIGVGISWPKQAPPTIVLPEGRELRPFQTEAVPKLLLAPSFALAWSMRVGKSTVGIVAGATLIATRAIGRVIVLGPANTLLGWEQQVKQMYPGLPSVTMDGRKNVLAGQPKTKTEKELRELRKQSLALCGAAFVFCQHDLMAHRAKDLLWLAEQGSFAVGCDEPQSFADFKAPRSVALMDLAQHPNAYRRWAFSGTLMRNKSADLPVTFEFLGCPPPPAVAAAERQSGKKHKRSPWGYLIRYAGAREVEHNEKTGESHWEACDVETEPEELKAKLWSIGHKLTREEVAPWLPPMERTVIMCDLNKEMSAKYRALESRLGKSAMEAVNGSDRQDALKMLSTFVTQPKLQMVVERLRLHADERGVKVIAGVMYHESLERLIELLFQFAPGQPTAKAALKSPVFTAAGWDSPAKRHEQIEQWKATPGPAVLLCNTLANSVGIDLADAEVQVNGELAWVPSDALQWEARVMDVHQGKALTPKLVEYVLAKGTIDEDMALAMLTKMGAITRIIGTEREQIGLDAALRASGLVSVVDLGLADRSDVGVQAALDGLRRRLLGEAMSDPGASTHALAGAVAEAFEEDEAFNSEDEEAA